MAEVLITLAGMPLAGLERTDRATCELNSLSPAPASIKPGGAGAVEAGPNQSLSLKGELPVLGGISFTGAHDSKASSVTNQLHVETKKSALARASVDVGESDLGKGKFEKTKAVTLSANPLGRLGLKGSFSSTDRDSGSTTSKGLGLQLGLTKSLNFSANLADAGSTSKRDYNLSGTLAKQLGVLNDVKIAALQSVEQKDGQPSVDRSSVSINSTAPKVGWLHDTRLAFSRTSEDSGAGSKTSANYSVDSGIDPISILKTPKFSLTSVDNRDGATTSGVDAIKFDSGLADVSVFKHGRVQFNGSRDLKENRTEKAATGLRFESELMDGKFATDYAASMDANQLWSVSKGFSFERSSNRLKLDVSYRAKSVGLALPVGIHKCGFEYKLTQRATFSVRQFSMQERPDGEIDRVGGTVMNLSTAIKRFNLGLSFQRDQDLAQMTGRNCCGLSLSGKLWRNVEVGVGYQQDSLGEHHSVHAKYEHKIDDHNLLSISGDLKTMADAARRERTDTQARIDLKRRW